METWQQWITFHLGPIQSQLDTQQPNQIIRLQSGVSYFLKRYAGRSGPDQCQSEAKGLHHLHNALADIASALQAITPIAEGDNWLLLPLIESSHLPPNWSHLGRGLAQLHSQKQTAFRFDHDNFCGPTPQPNTPCDDGYRFFADQRLSHQGYLNLAAGHLTTAELKQLKQLCLRLPELIPPQNPALLHGDLWSGNVLFDTTGTPHLIDPACHFGWPEADLAMTLLFGGFDPEFYHSYGEVRALEPGWQDRAELYNLYHLLNHLYLFGASYYLPVKSILNRYAD